MKYSIKVNEVKNSEGNVRGFATVVFGDSFKITNIAILENRKKGKLFVSMLRYRSNERDKNNSIVYKDICNPITAEFREELYGNILDTYEETVNKTQSQNPQGKSTEKMTELPEFSVKVSPFEKEGSNIRGFARIYFEDSFIVNNVSILQGKDKVFVAMSSYKTKQTDEHVKAVYQDVCYPVTKEFREKLYGKIVEEYEKAKEQSETKAKAVAENQAKEQDKGAYKQELPFR